jgi:hypothetical protein
MTDLKRSTTFSLDLRFNLNLFSHFEDEICAQMDGQTDTELSYTLYNSGGLP